MGNQTITKKWRFKAIDWSYVVYSGNLVNNVVKIATSSVWGKNPAVRGNRVVRIINILI